MGTRDPCRRWTVGRGARPRAGRREPRIGERAGYPAGHIRTPPFRHTYTSARLVTLDRGAPVSLYTVSRELDHGSMDTAERISAHLGTVRHRSEAVEFRIEQHAATLGTGCAGSGSLQLP